jgi:Flp pilus assembly protein TadD
MALCLAKRGRTKRADEEIRIALAADPKPGSIFEAAMIANIEGRTDDALKLLESALAHGYSHAEVEHEREFANLRKDGRLQQLVQRTATMPPGSATPSKSGR